MKSFLNALFGKLIFLTSWGQIIKRGVGGQRMEGRRDQGAGRQQPDRLSVGRKIYRAGLGGAVYLQ